MRYLAAFLCVALLCGCGPSYSELLAIYNGEREELDRVKKELAIVERQYAAEQAENSRLGENSIEEQIELARGTVRIVRAQWGETNSQGAHRVYSNTHNVSLAEDKAIRILKAESAADLIVTEQWMRDLENDPESKPHSPVVEYDEECQKWMDEHKDWAENHFKTRDIEKKRWTKTESKMRPLIVAAKERVTDQQSRVDEAKRKMVAARR